MPMPKPEQPRRFGVGGWPIGTDFGKPGPWNGYKPPQPTKPGKPPRNPGDGMYKPMPITDGPVLKPQPMPMPGKPPRNPGEQEFSYVGGWSPEAWKNFQQMIGSTGPERPRGIASPEPGGSGFGEINMNNPVRKMQKSNLYGGMTKMSKASTNKTKNKRTTISRKITRTQRNKYF